VERKGSGRGGKGKEVKWKRTGEERRRGLKGREKEGKGKRKMEGRRESGEFCAVVIFFRKNPVNLIAFIEFDYAVGTPLNHVVINAIYASNSYTYYY